MTYVAVKWQPKFDASKHKIITTSTVLVLNKPLSPRKRPWCFCKLFSVSISLALKSCQEAKQNIRSQ